MPDWLIFVFILGGVLLGGYSIRSIIDIVQIYFEIMDVNSFKRDFEAAVKHSQPPWEEMKEIIRVSNLSQARIYRILRITMKNILAGEAEELEPYKDLISSYIVKHNEEEPFEGMPSEIRIHLERLRERIEGQAELLEPLTEKIKDLLSINEKERRNQKYYTMGGFFVGVLGFLFAAYTYFVVPSAG